MRAFKIFAPLVVLLVLWVWVFQAEGAFKGGPAGKAFDADFAMFFGAARVLETGGNPYDHALLYRTEKAYLAQQHLPILNNKAIVRVGNPPLFFWLLSPLTHFPFQPVAWIWSVFLYLVTVAGFVALLKYFGWLARFSPKLVIPLVMFVLAPQVVFGPFYGNGVGLAFAAIAFALVLGERYPIAAGALLSVAWLKPPPCLPIVLLLFLFHFRDRRRALIGFVGATAVLAALMIGVTGPERIPQWLHGLSGYSADINTSPDIASFSGIYVRLLPHHFRLFAQICSLSVAIILTTLAWHRYRSSRVPFLAVAWLWVFWFLAAPYAHFFDEILLAAPVLALLGAGGRWATSREAVWGVYCAMGSLLLLSAAPFNVQFLWLPLAVLMLCLFVAARKPERLRSVALGLA
jgi:hypothetical protein